MLCVVVGVFIVVGSDSTHTYHVAVRRLLNPSLHSIDFSQIVGFLAVGLVYMPSIINVLVYSSDGAKEASAAGFILLSMVMVGTFSFHSRQSCIDMFADRVDILFWFHTASFTQKLH